MDYDKLIEQLKKSADFEDYPVVASFAAIIEKKYLREAATALFTLQAENKRLNKIVCSIPTTPDSGRTVSQYDKEMSMCAYLDDLEAKNEKLRAELEQAERCIEIVEKQRDAAIKDLERLCRDDVGPCKMTICELCAYNSGVQCSSPDGRSCDGYDVFNWKWRGPKKED